MSKSFTKIGDGIVEIELDGRTQELVPTLEACAEISAIAGGIGAAVQRCRQLHFETLCEIVGAGLVVDGHRLNAGQRDKLVPKAVIEQGLIYVMGRCVMFCHVIANGGNLPSEDDAEEGDEDDGPLGSATLNSTPGSSSS